MTEAHDSIAWQFKKLRERAGFSMDELAREMGYSRASSIQRYESPDNYVRKKFISVELAAKLAKAVVGRGEPPIEPKDVWALSRVEGFIGSYDPDEPHYESDDDLGGYTREHWRPKVQGALPELDAKLGAGSGTVGEVINLPAGSSSISGHKVIAEWLIPLDYLRNEAKASPNSTFVMEIVGDSMSPNYMPGDRVIVDLQQNSLISDAVYAISDGNSEPQIKRLQNVPFSEPRQVIIISDNPVLERFTVELERVQIIGRICGHVARR